MSYVSMLDRLLELSQEESSVGTIGGMISHSDEYDDLYDRLMCVLIQVDHNEDK